MGGVLETDSSNVSLYIHYRKERFQVQRIWYYAPGTVRYAYVVVPRNTDINFFEFYNPHL